MSFFNSWAEYPPGYDRAVHGYYDPSRYYGKPDTPFSQVKLGEFGAWLSRRDKSPRGIMRALSRAYWKHNMTWIAPKKPGPAGFIHLMCACTLMSFCLDYPTLKSHRQYRYH
ncbi:hypothetical protein RUM43_004562 [Polyplax serrata]|uniref:ATP synthase subunit f, mitochondrial n=1 Tax=Polyplax serrata TaxID=468196 RepID=A0AAN8XLN9_POLSC